MNLPTSRQDSSAICDPSTASGLICALGGEDRSGGRSKEDKPDQYLAALAAYHRAMAETMRQIVDALPLSPGDRALDLGSGDGAWSRLLAERVGRQGRLAAVDIAPECLELTRQAVAGQTNVGLVRADAARLPLADGSFDLAWCAQSLYSLPRTLESLKELVRVVANGNRMETRPRAVAVLENDSLHDLLLPWPVELELAVRQAEWRSHVEQETPCRYYLGRWLSGVFQELGLRNTTVRVWATTWQAPLSADQRFFLEDHLAGLRRRVARRLNRERRDELVRLTTPGEQQYLLDRPDLAVTLLDRLAVGRLE